MPIFNVDVQLSLTIAVQAEDEDHAWDIARDDYRDVFRELDPRVDVDVTGEAKTLGQLKAGWDGICIPYGGDGNTLLKDLLPE